MLASKACLRLGHENVDVPKVLHDLAFSAPAAWCTDELPWPRMYVAP